MIKYALELLPSAMAEPCDQCVFDCEGAADCPEDENAELVCEYIHNGYFTIKEVK